MTLSFLPKTATLRGHTFLPELLTRGGSVLDLGANDGAFSQQITEAYDVSCYSVEANPDLAARLPETARRKARNFAVGGSNDPVTFFLSTNPEMSSLQANVANDASRPVTVPGRTLDAILDEFNLPAIDLLKVDIEGAETAIFQPAAAEGLRRCRQITVEFHDFLGAYPPVEVERMVGVLRDAGFYPVKFSRSNMNWLFVGRQHCGGFSRAWLTLVTRNVRWLGKAIGVGGETDVPAAATVAT